MKQNCLVTRLSAKVEDENLPILGEIILGKPQLSSETADSTYIKIDSLETINFRFIKGERYTDDSLTSIYPEKEFINKQFIGWVTSNTRISITPKYKINNIEAQKLYIKDVVDLNNTDIIRVYTEILTTDNGDITSLNLPDLVNCDLPDGLIGNINAFLNSKKLERLNIHRCHVNGNIEELGSLTYLTYLGIAETDVTGSIEGFVNRQIANGRTSGRVNLPYAKAIAGVTYRGVLLPTNAEMPNPSGSNAFSWNTNGDITWE